MTTKVEIVSHQGRTAIAVDGRVIPGMSYFTYMMHSGQVRREILKEMVDSGTRIFFCLWKFWRSPYRREPWGADGTIDFTPLDEYMDALASMADDLWFIPRLYVATPKWWADRHPEELARFSDGAITAAQADGQDLQPQASMASPLWRQELAGLVRRLVEHVENGPHAARVLGYMLNSGGTEEWVYWGAQDGRMPDYSAPAEAAFRRWLREKYASDAALAEAWWQPALAVERAAIPAEAERRRCAPTHARDPRLDQPSIDYDLFLSDLCADALLALCREVKQVTGRRRITGAFYGYLLWQSGYANAIVNNGHLAVRKLLDSPDIDFLTGITSYDNREPGGPGSFMLPVESIQAAGKLAFNEVDLRTHLSTGSRFQKCDVNPADMYNLWPLNNAAESVSVYRREFAHQVIHGAAWWNFDMNGGWYSCPELLEDFRRQAGIAEQALAWDMSSVSEVAGVISGTSPARHRYYTMQDAMTEASWTDLQCDRATSPIYRTGAPIDWWMTDDLGRPEMRRYKVLYIYNGLYLSDRERAWIEQLKCDGRTLVFIGLPGLVTERAISLESACALTGMRLRLRESRQPALIEVTDHDHPVTRQCEAEAALGTKALVSPCLEVDDSAAEVLGVWRQSRQPGFAVRDFGSWRSIFCAAPINHTLIFRGIVETAGCHIWVEPGRIAFANRSLLALHIAPFSQPLRVHLPEPMTVTELFSGTLVARNAKHFLVQDTRRHATWLYHLNRMPAS